MSQSKNTFDKNRATITLTELKQFALTMSWAIPCLFMLLLPWIFTKNIPWWPLVISAILMTLYFIYPKGIKPFYSGWMRIAGVIGWINTRIILAVIFYLFIMPIGLLLRFFGKLQYQPEPRESEDSFWIKRDDKLAKEDLERPF